MKLVDAGFIWTEPHSRRLRVKLTIQAEVLNGVKLQQVFAVEFVLQNQQCDACARSYTDHVWRALVQVRQRVEHKKTFFLLEQLILRHGAHEKFISVEQVPTGVDFAFVERSHAMKFLDFLQAVVSGASHREKGWYPRACNGGEYSNAVLKLDLPFRRGRRSQVPVRFKHAKQLVSEDVQNAVMRYKHTMAVEIVPLCKDDVAVLPPRTAAACGSISPVVLVLRVSSNVFLLDPRTLQVAELPSERYWREPFRALASAARLEEFIVLDITPVTVAPLTGAALRRRHGGKGRGGLRISGSGGSTAGSVSGDKRQRDDDGGGRSTAAGSGRGGYTGAVSLAGGSVSFLGGGGGAGGAGAGTTVASTVTGGPRGKMLLADAEVMRTRDMGVSDTRYTVRTHLGNILRPGDAVLGYDLTAAVYNEDDAHAQEIGGGGSKAMRKGAGGRSGRDVTLPDIVLVRKVFVRQEDRLAEARAVEAEVALAALAAADAAAAAGASGDVDMGGLNRPTAAEAAAAAAAAAEAAARKRAARVWKLKRLSDTIPSAASSGGGGSGGAKGAAGANKRATRTGGGEGGEDADFESFLRDIEEDAALRASINLYKDKEGIAARARQQQLQQQAQARGGAAGAAAAPRHGSAAADDGDDEGDEGAGGTLLPEIGLEELLDDLNIAEAGVEVQHAPPAGLAGAYVDPEDAEALAKDAASTVAAEDNEDEGGSDSNSYSYSRVARAAAGAAVAAGETIAEENEDDDEGEDDGSSDGDL